MKQFMQAGKFKAECLKIMSDIQKSGQHLIITKHNVPIVEIIPYEKKSIKLVGGMKGTIHIKKDILHPMDEKWNAFD